MHRTKGYSGKRGVCTVCGRAYYCRGGSKRPVQYQTGTKLTGSRTDKDIPVEELPGPDNKIYIIEKGQLAEC